MTPQEGRKLVGICWRSGKVDARRIRNYLSLADFADILTSPNITVVNLQYGDCETEIQAAEAALGINIVRWQDVDLKDDQESLAALINKMDVVISAGTAVAQMTLAVGTPLVMFGPRGWTWFGQDEYPWAGNVRFIAPEEGQQLNAILPRLCSTVKSLLN